MATIYSLGYGGRRLEDLISLLKEHNISLIADVRRFPKSKDPNFIMENLEANLREQGINYVFLGDFLGGFRRGGYKRYASKDPKYTEGIKKLLNFSRLHGNIAVLCRERKVSGCHRRYIIETLRKLSIPTVNLQ